MYNYYPPKKNFVIYIIVAVFSFMVGWQATSYGVLPTKDLPEPTDENSNPDDADVIAKDTDLSLFWTVWGELSKSYYKEEKLDKDTMVYGAIKGMVSALDDPYTVFMDPEESKDFSDSLGGTLEGIGAELTEKDGKLTIVSPLRDSPAEKAGLLPGDAIYMIDDEYSADMDVFDAIMKIRGKKGTSVTLTILRKNVKDPFEVTIVRDSITIDSVTVEKLDGGLVYLSISQFSDNTLDEFATAFSDMVLNQPKGLIIDLRFNGGGYLDAAVDILSYLLPAGSTAVKIDEKGKEEKLMKTDGHAKILDMPIVVLVNEGSASASEIMAGAIQDLKRGVIMGTKTFGKGTVQEVESFQDGSSIRMTIANWLTPNGRNINEVGLEPDIVVELKDEDLKKDIDTQKEAAIKYLKELKK
ncbi:MAG: S41 family peptidase [Candidatus Gracilibacteria bacterium]|jgi:carboxyl-terminal processing protease